MNELKNNCEIRIDGLEFGWSDSGFRLSIDRLRVPAGKKTAFVGPSGSGKTTLLNLMSGIITPDRGEIDAAGVPLHSLNDANRRQFRIRHVGMVFQQFELLPYLRATENVLLPYYLNASLRLDAAAVRRAKQLLKDTGLENRIRSFPGQMSQGEQQRLALCRALVSEPTFLFADEPTGNLDNANKSRVMDLMIRQVDRRQLTMVMVTHDTSLLDRFDHVIDFSKFTRAEVSA